MKCPACRLVNLPEAAQCDCGYDFRVRAGGVTRSPFYARCRVPILAAVVLGLAVIPFESPECPAWHVTVVDEAGQPAPDIAVRMVFQNYSAERESREEDKVTDRLGLVTFQAQTLRASLARRCYYTLLSTLEDVHASFGPHAYVLAFRKKKTGPAVDFQRGGALVLAGGPIN